MIRTVSRNLCKAQRPASSYQPFIPQKMANLTEGIGLGEYMDYEQIMGQDDLILVIGRMERAISRLENSLAAERVHDGENPLYDDYMRLRSAAEKAIGQIDALTGSGDSNHG